MLGKAPYPTLNKLINALRNFYMREDEDKVPKKKTITGILYIKGKGRGNYSQRKGNNKFNSRGRGFNPAGEATSCCNFKWTRFSEQSFKCK